MTTAELRRAFVLDGLFLPGRISMVYCDTDRAIVGGAVPSREPLALQATKKELAAEYFNERRELGIVNIGNPGSVTVDGEEFPMAMRDMLYVGRGARSIQFNGGSGEKDGPAFYFVSFPAHASYPHTRVTFTAAEKARLGAPETANRRTINKYIHEKGARSAQLVMGLTELETGSVWNTMPPHTHQRRMEIYLYFGLAPEAITLHLMGEPSETRSLVLRNRQAVISPSWSIHCAAATTNYSFIWAMGGENQEFGDMDAVDMQDIY
jgi:4-deoxy-L-threo-5-hexosulose-uronate ketol-isomerase